MMKHFTLILIIFSLVFSFLLIPLSWFRYVSFGLDYQEERAGQVYQHYVHIQMIGNGSIGLDLTYYPVAYLDEPLDLGAAFNRQVRRPRPRNWLNRLGFWRLVGKAVYRRPTTLGYYYGIPIWVPFFINSAVLFLYLKHLKKKQSASE